MQQSRPRPTTGPRPRPRRRPFARISRGRLYDVVSAGARVGVGWVFAEYGLALRGREDVVAERLIDAGLSPIAFVSPLVPPLLVALSISFAVGLLTWLTGPLLALAALVGTFTAGTEPLSLFGSWGATILVTAVCALLAVGGGRWSWDHLILGTGATGGRRRGRRSTSTVGRGSPAISPRRPEHAPPLLYPVDQAALRRPSRL